MQHDDHYYHTFSFIHIDVHSTMGYDIHKYVSGAFKSYSHTSVSKISHLINQHNLL